MKVEEMKAWFPIADAARNAALREDQNDQMGALADAIAAVAPLIRRAALEEAAGVAEDKAASLDELGEDIAKRAVVGAHPYLVRATDARAIAAAIRALDT